MTSFMGVALTFSGLVGVLVGMAFGPRWLPWVAKPIASTGFLIVAWSLGAFESRYGVLVFAALVFFWVGDLLLIPPGRRLPFVLGLFSFLLGHLTLCAVFFSSGVEPLWLGGGVIVMAVFIGFLGSWLGPHLPSELRAAVWIYICVIGLMAAAAAGFFGAGGAPAALIGAVSFTISDVAVARNRFVKPGISNRLWGLPLYYGAVLLLASTVGS